MRNTTAETINGCFELQSSSGDATTQVNRLRQLCRNGKSRIWMKLKSRHNDRNVYAAIFGGVSLFFHYMKLCFIFHLRWWLNEWIRNMCHDEWNLNVSHTCTRIQHISNHTYGFVNGNFVSFPSTFAQFLVGRRRAFLTWLASLTQILQILLFMF